MVEKNVFLMDGTAYHVNVTELVRKFSVLDTENSGRTLDGQMYRDPIGTFYNYSMTVSPCDGDMEAMDAFWEAISQPQKHHSCTFPYNQSTLTQKMYVTSGEQGVIRITDGRTYWGEVTVNFVAMSPRVTV